MKIHEYLKLIENSNVYSGYFPFNPIAASKEIIEFKVVNNLNCFSITNKFISCNWADMDYKFINLSQLQLNSNSVYVIKELHFDMVFDYFVNYFNIDYNSSLNVRLESVPNIENRLTIYTTKDPSTLINQNSHFFNKHNSAYTYDQNTGLGYIIFSIDKDIDRKMSLLKLFNITNKNVFNITVAFRKFNNMLEIYKFLSDCSPSFSNIDII